jgi:hypothetical protein
MQKDKQVKDSASRTILLSKALSIRNELSGAENNTGSTKWLVTTQGTNLVEAR